MRPNPLYHGRGDADTDRQIDADLSRPDGDEPAPPDDADVDNGCEAEEILCDENCVSPRDEANCGGCGRVCDPESACTCSGPVPECSLPGGRACFDSCGPEAIMCGGECYVQPDDDRCGVCGEHCNTSSGCECRLDDSDTTYNCMRLHNEEWVRC